MIIWDDYKYGKEILMSGSLKTKKWQYKELKALGCYLLAEKYQLPEMLALMKQICNEDIKYLTAEQAEHIFLKLIEQCRTGSCSKDIVVSVYPEEIAKIKALPYPEEQQLIFTMLIYKKWLDAAQAKAADGYYPWFACMKQDIFAEARLNRINSAKRQLLLNELIRKGYLYSEVKKLSKKEQRREQIEKKQMWSIPFLCRQGEPAFRIDSYINICNHYFNYLHNGYFTCSLCGGLFEKRSNRQLYCPSCRKQKQLEKYKNRYQKQKLPPFKNRSTP